MTALIIICAIGAAAVGGAFFTFSDFTMAGLKQLPTAQAIAVMQAINRAAPSPLFMLLLFGTGAACLGLIVLSGLHLDQPGSSLRLIGGGTYIASVVVTTITYHVPRNDRLDRVDPGSAEGANDWEVYQREWIPVNHLRSLAPLASAALLAVSLT